TPGFHLHRNRPDRRPGPPLWKRRPVRDRPWHQAHPAVLGDPVALEVRPRLAGLARPAARQALEGRSPLWAPDLGRIQRASLTSPRRRPSENFSLHFLLPIAP